MSSSGYTAWSVSAGEVPTSAFWNILGANDASFNTGNGFNDGILQNRHIGTSMFSAGVQSYTNGGSAGGTFYFANFGGFKMCWGQTGNVASGGTAYNISMPATFFTTIQSATVTCGPDAGTSSIAASLASISTSTVSFFINAWAGSGTMPASAIIIGT